MSVQGRRSGLWLLVLVAMSGPGRAPAQPLSLDGVTGGWLNPWALVSPAERGHVGRPAVAYHFLDAGPVVGDLGAPSLAVGINGNLELGYSHYFIDGSTPVVSSDLDVLAFKYAIARAKRSRPAISAGAFHRWSDARDLSSTDMYLVATRIFTLGGTTGKALLVNAGIRSSEAAIFGIAGRARHREGLPFGTLALILDEHVTLGAEATEQPGTDTNTSLFLRLIPDRKQALQLVVALAHVEDSIQAGSQFASSVTYRF